MKLQIKVSNLQESTALVEAIATVIRPGDVVLLDGPLGSGKTLLARGMIRFFCPGSDVTSPTFGVAHFYDSSIGRLIHIDTYRLNSIGEYVDLGLDEYLKEAVLVIEWGEFVSCLYPEALRIEIRFSDSDEEHRLISITSESQDWKKRMTIFNEQLVWI